MVVVGMVGLAVVLCFGTLASASVATITVYPDDVPDESLPRECHDAPDGWGDSSWQGPETGKSNIHFRFDADGDLLSALFPDDAATLTIADIASISYHTLRPDGTVETRDWWVQIYTRPDDVDDASSWYGYRFINNYNDHTETGDWTEYSTSSGMTFHRNDKYGDASVELTLDQMATVYGDELIEMISIQTDSGWDGFEGCVDGLTITLKNENVGQVDFAAVPEPTTLTIWGAFGGLGLIAARRRRRTA